MSKEIEALEELRDFRYGEDKLLVCQTEMYSIIKKALEHLESIDNSNPSEALKSLEKMIRDFNETTTGINGPGEIVVGNELLYFHKKELDTIEQALFKAQELEKENARYKEVFELVKEKGVDISIIMSTKTVEEYNVFIQYCNSSLSEVEYNILKEMFA